MKEKIFQSRTSLRKFIGVARGISNPECVIKNGKILDVFNREFIQGDIAVHQGVIVGTIDNYEADQVIDADGAYIVPGFIDAHVHIESSMLTPFRYQETVLPKGTTTVIWDPHEIVNVKGIKGIEWALAMSDSLWLDVFFMLSSCVPSLDPKLEIETSAHTLEAKDLAQFMNHPRVLGLAEMMNFPGVLGGANDVMDKLLLFKDKKIDGHCPLLFEKELNAYILAGISSDHEVSELKEAKEKIIKGMTVLIREGSCEKNADDLLPILNASNVSRIAFCSDDRNPADLCRIGHIDHIINKALKLKLPPEIVFSAASYSAAVMYGLTDRGAIAPGCLADLCFVKPIKGRWQKGMTVEKVYKNGRVVSRDELKESKQMAAVKKFTGKNVRIKFPGEISSGKYLRVDSRGASGKKRVPVIGIRAGRIITDNLTAELKVVDGAVEPDVSQDVLKIAVFERHQYSGNYAVGFVKGFHLKRGAMAASISHDAHNVVAVGASDSALTAAVNRLTKIDGGIVVVDDLKNETSLPLPIGGLMTDRSVEEVVSLILALKAAAKKLGCRLEEPFLQMAFLALPVIPALKITDRGLFDAVKFERVKI